MSTPSILFCSTGMYVSRHCTEFRSTSCASCTEGTFQDGDNGREQCFACKHCDAGTFSLFILLAQWYVPMSFKTLSPLKQEHELNYVKWDTWV